MAAISVTIKWGKEKLAATVKPDDTPTTLFAQLEERTGVPVARQKLMAKGAWRGVLKAEMSLAALKDVQGWSKEQAGELAGKAKEGCMHFLGASSSDCAENVEPELRYVQNDEGAVELAYRVECDLGNNWMESYVSAETGAVISQVDYFHEAGSGTYSAYAKIRVD